MAVDRAQVSLGAGDYDVCVGTPAGVIAAVLLDADGHGPLGVYSLGYRLDIEVHQFGLGTNGSVNGVADCVNGAVSGASIGDGLAVRSNEFDGACGDSLVAAGELHVFQCVTYRFS